MDLRTSESAATSAADAVVDVLQQVSGLAYVEVLDIPHRDRERPNWDITNDERAALNEAKELRAEYGVPYWEAVMLRFERRGLALPHVIVDATGHHNDALDETVHAVDERSLERLREFALVREDGGFWVLRSRIAMQDGTEQHLPMLDFRLAKSEAATETIERVLQNLGVAGVLVSTDRSYHFYGGQPIPPSELHRFLARASLFTPVVDQRWIAHQQLDGVCALRLSTREGGITPQVVRVIH